MAKITKIGIVTKNNELKGWGFDLEGGAIEIDEKSFCGFSFKELKEMSKKSTIVNLN